MCINCSSWNEILYVWAEVAELATEITLENMSLWAYGAPRQGSISKVSIKYDNK